MHCRIHLGGHISEIDAFAKLVEQVSQYLTRMTTCSFSIETGALLALPHLASSSKAGIMRSRNTGARPYPLLDATSVMRASGATNITVL